jgi:hypothetical protein
MDHDYGGSINVNARIREVIFMHDHPDTPFFTVFDYGMGRVSTFVQPLTKFPRIETRENQARWAEDVLRMEKSGGRLALHLICVSEAGRRQYWLVPLRSATSTVYDGLRHLAAALPAARGTWNMLNLENQIRGLLIESGGPGKEVH